MEYLILYQSIVKQISFSLQRDKDRNFKQFLQNSSLFDLPTILIQNESLRVWKSF